MYKLSNSWADIVYKDLPSQQQDWKYYWSLGLIM
jgi:hypothetical protein